ncbi:MAG TPA: Hsp20/alpha crystallin family protein [Thermoanaerobaculia bacterium]|nr:Hsp20/alpha crystallin family protein [Thermoanaerobaculia bacterium]
MTQTTTMTRRPASALPSVLEQFFDDSFFGPSWLQSRDESRNGWFPAVDLSQTPERFLIKVDLPGMTKEDIDLTVENQTLTLTGERRFENSEESETFSRVERSYGKFSRTFQLPNNVDTVKVKAQFADGVLTVTIPKSEEGKSRTVSIA